MNDLDLDMNKKYEDLIRLVKNTLLSIAMGFVVIVLLLYVISLVRSNHKEIMASTSDIFNLLK